MKIYIEKKKLSKAGQMKVFTALTLVGITFLAKSASDAAPLFINKTILSPVYAAQPTPTPTITPSPTPTQKDIIKAEIVQVFGKDAPKAFKLLSCENSSLNPETVNTAGNTPVGSRDIGVFQINEYWQKTQAKFLFNWKINIQIAKQLFDENGKSFNMWSCGKRMAL